MALIGYKVRTNAVGVAIVEGVEGKPIDKSELCHIQLSSIYGRKASQI
jgi:hypothetical protein